MASLEMFRDVGERNGYLVNGRQESLGLAKKSISASCVAGASIARHITGGGGDSWALFCLMYAGQTSLPLHCVEAGLQSSHEASLPAKLTWIVVRPRLFQCLADVIKPLHDKDCILHLTILVSPK